MVITCTSKWWKHIIQKINTSLILCFSSRTKLKEKEKRFPLRWHESILQIFVKPRLSWEEKEDHTVPGSKHTQV